MNQRNAIVHNTLVSVGRDRSDLWQAIGRGRYQSIGDTFV